MPIWTIFLIAIGLAMDCFAVSLGVGTAGTAVGVRPTFRLFFHFGLFQAGMTLLGWLAGKTVVNYISSVDHWLAFGLLMFVGVRMIRGGLQKAGAEPSIPDPSRGLTLVMLSVATSIDALAVGLSLAFLSANVFWAALLIGAGVGRPLSRGTAAREPAWDAFRQVNGGLGRDYSNRNRVTGVDYAFVRLAHFQRKMGTHVSNRPLKYIWIEVS